MLCHRSQAQAHSKRHMPREASRGLDMLTADPGVPELHHPSTWAPVLQRAALYNQRECGRVDMTFGHVVVTDRGDDPKAELASPLAAKAPRLPAALGR